MSSPAFPAKNPSNRSAVVSWTGAKKERRSKMNLFAISALLALGMLSPASLALPQYGQPEGKQKCDRFSDCPTYGWCFDTCITNYLPANDGDVSCRADSADGGKTWPDHSVCRASEVASSKYPISEEYTQNRCFEEIGFVCRSAIYMPCTPNYDSDGSITKLDQCPTFFYCSEVKWDEDDDAKMVCLPEIGLRG